MSPARCRARLAHPDDPAAANRNAGRANALERVEPILVIARRDHLAIELGRGVEIVVVVVEAGGLERLGLAVAQHAERAARLEAERLHFPDHREHRLEIAVLRSAPRGAHAEARRALRLRGARGRHDRVETEERLLGDAGVVALRLRTVAAILGAAAGLDRDERRELDRVRAMVRAVRLLRAEDEIGKRQREERFDGLDRPARARATRRATSCPRAFGRWHRRHWGARFASWDGTRCAPSRGSNDTTRTNFNSGALESDPSVEGGPHLVKCTRRII